MTITLVQGPARGSAQIASGTFTITQTQTPAQGNALILCYQGTATNANPTITGISQTGVTWTKSNATNGAANGYQEVEIWLGAVGSSAGTTLTITVANGSGSGYNEVADVCEWTVGSAATWTVDKTAINGGNTNSGPTDTGTTATITQANELEIGAVGCASNPATQTSPTNGFTLLDGVPPSGINSSLAYLYKVVTAQGTANSGTSLNASAYWSGCIATFIASTGGGAASKLAYTAGASQSVNAGSVSSVITVQVQDANSNPVTTGATVNLSTSSSGGHFYSDSGGNTQITSITISSGQSSGNCYYKDTTAGTPTLTASATGLTSATTQFTISSAASKLTYTAGASQSITVGSVSNVITVQAQDSNGNPVTTGATVSLSTSSTGGSFYSDSGGSTQISSVVISSGQSSANFYYKDTTTGTPTLTASSTGLTSATTQFTISSSGSLSASPPLQLSGNVISIPQANGSTNGYLASSDWNTFNNKQNSLTIGNLNGTTNQVNVSGGTGAIIGSGVSLSLPQNIHTDASPTFAGLTINGSATIGNGSDILIVNGITLLKNDVGCYGFFGSSSDPSKGTGGGAIMVGHGFTSPTDNPQFALTDTVGGGSGATASLSVNSNGTITSVNVTNQGSNYYFADVDIRKPTNGSGTRLAPVVNGPITGIHIINGGRHYSTSDTIVIKPLNQGAHAVITSVDSNGSITGINVTSQGDNYIPGQASAEISPPTNGAGAQFLPIVNGKVKQISVVPGYGGAGYSTSDIVDITNTPHNTLILQQTANSQGDTLPAHLDLGNLTVHGDLTVDGGAYFSQDFLAALFAAASTGTALSSGIANIIDQGVLQVINNVLGIKPTAAPTLSNLTLTGSLIEGGSFTQTGGLSINSGGDIQFYANNSPNNCHFKVASNGTNAFNPIWDITGNKSVLYVQRNVDGTDLLQTGSTILNDGYGNMTGVQNLYANAYTINGSHWGNLYGNTVAGNPAFSGTAYVWELAGTGLIIDGCLNVNTVSMNNGTLVLDNHSTGNGILQYGIGNYQGMRLAQTTNGYDQTHPSVLSLQTYTDAGHPGTFTWQLGVLDLSLLFVDHINSASGGGIYCFDHLKIYNGANNAIKLYDSTNQPGSDGQFLKNVGGYPQWTTIQQGVTYTGQAPISVNGSVISIAQANGSTSGYLSSGDWNTFNNKYGSGSSPTFASLSVSGQSSANNIWINGSWLNSSSTLYIGGASGAPVTMYANGNFNPIADATYGLGGGGNRWLGITAISTYTNNLSPISGGGITVWDSVNPVYDNAYGLGSGSNRWAGIVAINGYFNAIDCSGLVHGGGGSGDAFQVGDDIYIVDINNANRLSLQGAQDRSQGGIQFGSGGPYVYKDGSYMRVNCGWIVDGYIVASSWASTSQYGPLYRNSSGQIGYNTSSERFKDNINSIEDCSWLYNLRPVTFDWKDPERAKSDGIQLGLIAEEVNEQCSQLVFQDSEGKPEGVHYEWLGVPLLVEIKKLRNRVEALESQLKQNQAAA